MKMKTYCFALLLLTSTCSLSAFEFWIFAGDWNYQVNADGSATIGAYVGSDADVVIPSSFGAHSVTVIGDGAFQDNKTITSVIVPDGVKTLETNVFNECNNLTSVTLPQSLTSIGESAFNGCIHLTSASIPESVTSIGRFAFASCFRLQTVNIPEGVTVIDHATFIMCSSLTSIHIPDSVTEIWMGAFSRCDSLTSVTIPPNVSMILESAFAQCSNLTTAIFEGDAPTTFEDSVFDRTSPAFSIQYYQGRAGWTTPVWNGYLTILNAPEAPPAENQGTAPIITQNPLSQNTDLYQSVSFSIAVTSSLPLRYQWIKDGQELSGANGPTYSIASANVNNAGNYYCRVSNSIGSVNSATATLTVASYVKVPLYRFSRNDNPSHFFTAVEAEKEIVIEELGDYFSLEGISHYVVAAQQSTAMPVYRMYNSLSGAHFYTASEIEKNNVLATLDYFTLEGVAFYVFLWAEQGTLPVYRFYVPETGSHFFTIDEAEKNLLISSGQQTRIYEGIAWYAFPTS